MKLFMLWDMEGVSGLVSCEQVWFWEPGVRKEVAETGRLLLVADINSAVTAALEAGCDEVIVTDTHHGGGNITLPEMVADPRVTYNLGSRGYQGDDYRWLPGLDEGVDGFLVMGHHAKAGTPGAFLPHTNNLDWADVTINGRSVGEMGIESCYAAHWRVPTIMAQADEHGVAEAEARFPGIVTAAVKRSAGFGLAVGPSPEEARRLTAARVKEAVLKARLRAIAPVRPELPMTVAITMTSAGAAEKAAQRHGVERVDELTVRGTVARHCDVMKWITGDGLNQTPRQ
jgi:D-amino peptidase